jgi:hypothetical protein
MHFYLLDPILNILKRLAFVYGVSEHNAHSPSVVGLRDGFESLLASRIPNLEPDFIFANGNSLNLEIDSDCGEMRSHEIILTEPEEHVRLADAAVANHEQFDQIIVTRIFGHFTI